MVKYHIDLDGNVKLCSASIKKCKYGNLEDHYSTVSEARFAYENIINDLNKDNETFLMSKMKYPRTPHLPFSKTKTLDDVSGTNWRFLEEDIESLVSEKMDGENTTLYSDKIHARSIDSNYHESRSWIKELWSNIAYKIPKNRRIILENVYAEHSIRYDNLSTFAFGIGVVDAMNGRNVFRSWNDSLEIFDDLGITPVPVISLKNHSMKDLQNIFNDQDHRKQEGIVVRSSENFFEDDFGKNVGKAVREGHVQTDDHWTTHWKKNSLREN